MDLDVEVNLNVAIGFERHGIQRIGVFPQKTDGALPTVADSASYAILPHFDNDRTADLPFKLRMPIFTANANRQK